MLSTCRQMARKISFLLEVSQLEIYPRRVFVQGPSKGGVFVQFYPEASCYQCDNYSCEVDFGSI